MVPSKLPIIRKHGSTVERCLIISMQQLIVLVTMEEKLVIWEGNINAKQKVWWNTLYIALCTPPP